MKENEMHYTTTDSRIFRLQIQVALTSNGLAVLYTIENHQADYRKIA